MKKILIALSTIGAISDKKEIERNKKNIRTKTQGLKSLVEIAKFMNNFDRSLGIIAKYAENNKRA